MNIRFVYMTAANAEEARKIGKELVTQRLAACVNIFEGMNSIYMWEGKLQDDREAALIAKTSEERVPALMEKVRSLHSYSCPCIVTLRVDGGNPAFLEWIAGEVK